MSDIEEPVIETGDQVERAIGELHATVASAAKATSGNELDVEEVTGWLHTFIRVIKDVFKFM